jgi:hypothetical protein
MGFPTTTFLNLSSFNLFVASSNSGSSILVLMGSIPRFSSLSSSSPLARNLYIWKFMTIGLKKQFMSKMNRLKRFFVMHFSVCHERISTLPVLLEKRRVFLGQIIYTLTIPVSFWQKSPLQTSETINRTYLNLVSFACIPYTYRILSVCPCSANTCALLVYTRLDDIPSILVKCS